MSRGLWVLGGPPKARGTLPGAALVQQRQEGEGERDPGSRAGKGAERALAKACTWKDMRDTLRGGSS